MKTLGGGGGYYELFAIMFSKTAENSQKLLRAIFLTLNRPGFLESSTAGGGGRIPPSPV